MEKDCSLNIFGIRAMDILRGEIDLDVAEPTSKLVMWTRGKFPVGSFLTNSRRSAV